MCAILKLPGKGCPNNIFFIYDFTQVDDTVMMVLYANKLCSWEKIFINYENGEWRTDAIINYTDDETYSQICSNLEFIFNRQERTNKQIDTCLEKIMEDHAVLVLGVCS